MRFKKLGSMLLAGALALGALSAPIFTTEAKALPMPVKYNDVRESDWFHGYVMWAYSQKVMRGYGDGT